MLAFPPELETDRRVDPFGGARHHLPDNDLGRAKRKTFISMSPISTPPDVKRIRSMLPTGLSPVVSSAHQPATPPRVAKDR